MTSFSELKLSEPLSRALTSLGYETPTPIQAQAIPHLLEGRDLLGIAQTGTGKTAAFALPTLDYIFTEAGDPPKRGARALVLAPTRELVGQIHDSFVSYGRFMMDLNVAKITGGVSIGAQIKRLVHGNDVIVATPGRLIDLLDRKAITLKDIEVLILDEADQMMDMGFIHALKKIVPLLPKDRQTLFFSATLPPKIKTLANQFLTNPVQVTVSPPNTTADRVTQSLIYATSPQKPMLLADILLQPGTERTLVFTRTKHGADRVVKRLAMNGMQALAIHGNKSQGQRQRALDAFKNRQVDILVATDVAARGIDIPGITHVINYEIPNVPEQYVHRIGRTARANAEGHAIALVAPDEKAYLKDIQKILGETIPVQAQPEDMDARIKVIQARPKVEPVSTAPDTGRKGRGKSGKKKDRSRGKKKPTNAQARTDARTPRGDRSEDKLRNSNADAPRSNSQRSEGPRAERAPKSDDQGFRRRNKNSSGSSSAKQNWDGGKSAAAEGGVPRRKTAPTRDRKPSGAPSKPRTDAPKSAGKSGNRSDVRRQAPGRNSGGNQSPKRRSR